MTSLEMFTKARDHLLAQNCKSVPAGGILHGCAYRGTEGLKCAVGALIPDAKYDAAWEGISVDGLPEDFLGAPVTEKQFMLLGDLQHIHDEMPVVTWSRALNDLGALVARGDYDA